MLRRHLYWAFELPRGLHLDDSDQAQKLATSLPVSVRRVTPSAKLTAIIDQGLKEGFLVNLNPTVTLHGDAYSIWGRCSDSDVESSITLPAGVNNKLTKWMNDAWKETERGVSESASSRTVTPN